ncbi:MAG: hypothetical protein CME64_06870 [Halobacteriovoraceae bacterium]|nr:hypothetical protein [Halobacteriovoraceae bacterium]
MRNIAIKTLKVFVILQLLVLNTSCLDYSRNMVDGKLEPPEPGFFENDKTIGGIDSNNDGVRDDIERWINREFPGEENYNKRMACKQYAKEVRNIQIHIDDEEMLNKHSFLWIDADVCVLYVYTDLIKDPYGKQVKQGDKILEKSNNTKERVKAWMVADRNFAGKSHALPPRQEMRRKKCEFEIKPRKGF